MVAWFSWRFGTPQILRSLRSLRMTIFLYWVWVEGLLLPPLLCKGMEHPGGAFGSRVEIRDNAGLTLPSKSGIP